MFSDLKDTQLRVTEGNAKMKLNHKLMAMTIWQMEDNNVKANRYQESN